MMSNDTTVYVLLHALVSADNLEMLPMIMCTWCEPRICGYCGSGLKEKIPWEHDRQKSVHSPVKEKMLVKMTEYYQVSQGANGFCL